MRSAPATATQPQCTEQAQVLLGLCGNPEADLTTCRDVLLAASGDMDRAVDMLLEVFEGQDLERAAAGSGLGEPTQEGPPGQECSREWIDEWGYRSPPADAPAFESQVR
jgi:hypothetical protein